MHKVCDMGVMTLLGASWIWVILAIGLAGVEMGDILPSVTLYCSNLPEKIKKEGMV